MPWLQVTLVADGSDADAISEVFDECGALAVSLEDAGGEPLLAIADEAPLWREVAIGALFPLDVVLPTVRAQVEAAAKNPRLLRWDIGWLADEAWERVWLTRFKPLDFGAGLWVCPSWLTPPEPTATNIVLDPGLAFGTGTHASTALCLEWIARHDVHGRTVLDFGCGSGILAIAALKRGARTAVGVDVDAQALAVSRENAARNGVAAQFAALFPDALATDTFDIVIANILAKPLIELAPQIAARVRAGASLLLAGLLTTQVAEVAAAYAPTFRFETHTRDEWAMLSAVRD